MSSRSTISLPECMYRSGTRSAAVGMPCRVRDMGEASVAPVEISYWRCMPARSAVVSTNAFMRCGMRYPSSLSVMAGPFPSLVFTDLLSFFCGVSFAKVTSTAIARSGCMS